MNGSMELEMIYSWFSFKW